MELPNGCSVSELKISPSNWNTKKTYVNEIWVIDFYFRSPETALTHPFGKRISLKEGINRVKLLTPE